MRIVKKKLNDYIVAPDINTSAWFTFMCKGRPITMDWDLELSNFNNENMIIVYEQEMRKLEIENNSLKTELKRLKSLLQYKETTTTDEIRIQSTGN